MKDRHPNIRRRRTLAGLLTVGAAMVFFGSRTRSAEKPIAQPARPGTAVFLARAFEMKRRAVAAGDQPYGAVVVKFGRIVGLGPSRVVTLRDATAHAEMEAIRDASRRLGTRDLSRCILYSTSPPCAMCETAAYWAGISKKVHGSEGTDGGAPRYGACS